VVNEHTNIVKITRNGQVLLEKEIVNIIDKDKPDYECLTIADIYDFAMTCDLADVQEILDRKIAYNTAIADEGLKNDYGANIGKTLLKAYGQDVHIRARARAAAGSDARMNGCELPVVINRPQSMVYCVVFLTIKYVRIIDSINFGDYYVFVLEKNHIGAFWLGLFL
jgi:L-cysteine desulfidase